MTNMTDHEGQYEGGNEVYTSNVAHDLLQRYKLDLIARGKSPKTIENYYNVVRQFMLRINYDINAINDESLKSFFLNRKNKMYSVAINEFAKAFNLYFILDWIKLNKDYLKNKKEPIREYRNKTEIGLIISKLPYPFNIICGLQWDAGLRIGAVLRLEGKNFYFDEDTGLYYVYVLEKGGKRVTRYIGSETATKLKEYLFNSNNQGGIIFNFGSFKTSYCIYEKHLCKVGKILNFKVTSHMIRRSRAVKLIRDGENIITVKEFLGHRKIDTTILYVSLAGQTSKNIILKEELEKIEKQNNNL